MWLLLIALLPPPPGPETHTVLRVVSGVGEDGLATALWLDVLRKRLPADRYEAVAGIRRPLSGEEEAWAGLIRSRSVVWQQMTPALADLFSPIPAPPEVIVVLGNRGAEDAFTHDARTIGFDLAALQAVYGSAGGEENARRIDHIFRHEFTHVMQRPWLQEHPWPMDSPLRAALFDVWAEGLGNYQSLSGDWLSRDGRRSERAARALAELEPRLVVRLAALACATPEAARPLARDLSSGRFDQKWGALTAALWLEAEPEGATAALRNYVTAGPAGFWELAERHLPEGLRPAMHEVQKTDALCAGR